MSIHRTGPKHKPLTAGYTGLIHQATLYTFTITSVALSCVLFYCVAMFSLYTMSSSTRVIYSPWTRRQLCTSVLHTATLAGPSGIQSASTSHRWFIPDSAHQSHARVKGQGEVKVQRIAGVGGRMWGLLLLHVLCMCMFACTHVSIYVWIYVDVMLALVNLDKMIYWLFWYLSIITLTWNEWCFGPGFLTVRLYQAGGNLAMTWIDH